MTLSWSEPLLALLAIMTIGWWIGNQQVRGLSLGSAGVLFVALVFGHFGMSVPREIMDFGLILFVYAVGLQAGPRFFRAFRRQGIQYLIIALVTVLAGAAATVAIALVMDLPAALAAGLFTGALTNTPALAAATDVIERILPGQSANAAAGYGIAYPYSMISVVVLVQVLPRLLRRDLRSEEQRWQAEQAADTPPLSVRKFILTNPNCSGKRISQVVPRSGNPATVSRIRRGNRVFPVTADIALEQGDIIMVVGEAAQLEQLRILFGEETSAAMDIGPGIVSVDLEVTEPALTGKTLAQLRVSERHSVVVTRLRRAGVEIVPTGAMSLDMGDSIRVVGERAAVDAFATLVRGSSQKAEETNMVPFLAGIVLGIILGSITIELGDGLSLKLGMAGGVFVVSLVVGHIGRIGRLRLYVPVAARNLVRELGLALFLAGAGANAGSRIMPIIQERGPSLLLAGAVITTVSVVVGLLVMLWMYRMNTLSTMGALCACMTNPPGLAAANGQTETNMPMLAYASVYPGALILKIILAQILVELLHIL